MVQALWFGSVRTALSLGTRQHYTWGLQMGRVFLLFLCSCSRLSGYLLWLQLEESVRPDSLPSTPGGQQHFQAGRRAREPQGSLTPLPPCPAFACKQQQHCTLDSVLLGRASPPWSQGQGDLPLPLASSRRHGCLLSGQQLRRQQQL